MERENVESIRQRVIALIESEYDSDAAFERALNLPPKTVNNWRRGRSSSFMKILPTLSELFSVNALELLDIPLRTDTSELSDEEIEILELYRKARPLPIPMRAALRETIATTINLYISAANETKTKSAAKRKNQRIDEEK